MKRLMIIFLLAAIFLPAEAFSEEVRIASIKSLKGQAFVLRGEQTLPVVTGMPLFEKDGLKTGTDSALSLIMLDDTTLTLGSESELELKEYLFDPKASNFSVILKMFKGTFIYLSGVIGKLAPDAIRLETPDTTIAVRGTRVMIKVVP